MLKTSSLPRFDPEDVRIGETIRVLFEQQGYKTGEFAAELGISSSHLSNITAGRRRVTRPLLHRIAQVLRVRPIAIIRDGYFEDVAA